jgi:alpha-tubulin suppressor-like RCC1 family protein
MKLVSILLSFLYLISFSNAQCWQKIASKQDHVIAIHEDGTLWNWGGGSAGNRLLTTPAILDSSNNWVDIAAGYHFYAAIKNDGSLWTWGENSSGQLGIGSTTNAWGPQQLGNQNDWADVSCGERHTVAVKTDGTLWIWGGNNNGQLGKGTNRSSVNIPEQLGTANDWVEVSAGRNHTLIRKSNNTLWFVGACYNTSTASQLWQVGTASDWATMAGGSFTDYAIKQNGQLWTWNNSNGRNTTPARVGNTSDWEKVDNSITYSPEYHALFIKTNGTLWAIGSNQFGQLGNGSTTAQTSIPTQIGNQNDWKEIVAGSHYSLALKTDNSFYAWGRNHHAQFGIGENKNTIRTINNTTFWKSVASASGTYNGHTLAIQNDGSLWAWGQNNDGQLGLGFTYNHQILPQRVGNDNDWEKISNGFHFSVGIKENGTLWVWGRNGRSQLGLPSTITNRTTPVLVNNDSDWVEVSAGAEFVIALKNNGTLWAWGYNFDGQMGNNSTTTITAPTQIGSDTNWVALSAGYHHSMGLKSDSTLWTWGSNQHGQLGRTGNTRIPIQVGTDKWLDFSAGGLHSLGIREDSTLWAWGRNQYSQLGDNSSSNKSTPIKIGNDSTWISIGTGYEHSLGIQSDSTLWAWGRNGTGQLGDTVSYINFLGRAYIPTKVNDSKKWKFTNGGPVNSVAIDKDGLLYTFGDSYVADNQLNFPQSGYAYSSPQMIYSCNFCNSFYDYSESICQGDSILFNGVFVSTPGSYLDTTINTAGCDSIITLNLIVLSPAQSTDTIEACETYTWIDGNTYTSDNNSATFIFPNAASNGCDSVVTLNLTILSPAQSVDTIEACETYTWIDGNTYTSDNNSATFIISNGSANGCDSIITLDLIILNPATSTDIIFACGDYTWIDGNTYTSDNNSATFIISNGAANGCDSIVNLNLVIGNDIYAIDTILSCNPITWIDGITYTENNNTATFTIPSLNNCDSIVTLNLSVFDIDNTVTQNQNILTANAAFVNYQWIDCNNNNAPIFGEINQNFTASVNGNYAVILSDEHCEFYSNCINVTGISDEITKVDLLHNIFPNPTGGKFYVESNFSHQIEIYDALGRLIDSYNITQNLQTIDISQAADGIYFIKSFSKDFYAVKKMVKGK